MKVTIRIIILSLLSAIAGGCSFYDFLSYEEDTGLAVIERPSGYPSAYFGAVMAGTSTAEMDLIAVSAGTGSPTIFYQVAAQGDLVDVVDPWADYLEDELPQAIMMNSGADLAGLPTFESQGAIVTGCVAISEPLTNSDASGLGKQSNVHIRCEQGPNKKTIVRPPEFGTAPEFGKHLAAIRPGAAEPWLLAVSSHKNAMVFSAAPGAAGKYSDLIAVPDEIADLAAGRMDEGRFFLALGTNSNPGRIYLFVQDAPGSPKINQVGCIERPQEPGFGGVLATGNLDSMGADELIVSAGAVANRRDAVYVYNVPLAIENFQVNSTCVGGGTELQAVVLPGAGELDVECPAGCQFGVAMAVGDISTDPASPGHELCVGAPQATVDGEDKAGAVYVYIGDQLTKGLAPVAGQVTDSMPEKDHSFGGGVAIAPIAGRNELLVGATGKGHVFIAFCTGVGADLEQGGDLPKNADGSVISTRCRL
jgi:hypothetical protein